MSENKSQISRDTYKKIKAMNREQMNDFLKPLLARVLDNRALICIRSKHRELIRENLACCRREDNPQSYVIFGKAVREHFQRGDVCFRLF